MKYELDQTIFYFEDNKVHSAPVVTRMKVENLHDDWDSCDEQQDMWQHFGKSGTKYVTCHGVYDESEVFASKEDLLASL